MSRKKIILSIFLLILLVIVGIVLPTVWKHQSQQSEMKKETAKSDGGESESHEKPPSDELKFQDFEKLSDFFPDTQIMDLKEQIHTYLEETSDASINSITFLPDETTYPDKQTTVLLFRLPNNQTIPVTYTASNGVFLFGEEMLQISNDTQTYKRESDDSLPPVTTEEIESRQEGGFPDTKATTKPATSEETTKQEEASISEEVQP